MDERSDDRSTIVDRVGVVIDTSVVMEQPDTGQPSDSSRQRDLPSWFADRSQSDGDRLPASVTLGLLAVGIGLFVGGWALPLPPPEAPDTTWPLRLSVIAAGLIVVVFGLRGRHDRITYWAVFFVCTATGGFSLFATAVGARGVWVLLILLSSAAGVLLTQTFGISHPESDQTAS